MSRRRDQRCLVVLMSPSDAIDLFAWLTSSIMVLASHDDGAWLGSLIQRQQRFLALTSRVDVGGLLKWLAIAPHPKDRGGHP